MNPFAALACPPGYTEYEFFPREDLVRLSAAHGPWLQELATRFQIAWATAWGADANRLLAPLLQLPDLPVIRFPPVPFHPRDKLPPIIRFAGRRPLTWIDDALPPEAHAWAADRRIPTLLIGIDPAEGLTRPGHRTIPAVGRSPIGEMISRNPDQLPGRRDREARRKSRHEGGARSDRDRRYRTGHQGPGAEVAQHLARPVATARLAAVMRIPS